MSTPATENLLTGDAYRPLYALKSFVIRNVGFLRAIMSKQVVDRERWVQGWAAKIPAGSQVLDIGAGSCPYREAFSHCRYFAQDFAELENHQLQTRTGYGKLDYVCDIATIPANTASFDVVICTEVIEHVPEPIKAVKEMARLLKPGGLLLLSAPLRSALHQMPYHFYAGYTPSWYEKFLSEAGFGDLNITPVCGVFYAYAEATLYLALYLSPFSNQSALFKLCLLPLFVLLLPWLVLAPPLFWLLDKLNVGMEFTIDYLVEAKRL